MEQRDVIFDIERSDGRRFVLGSGTDWKIPNDAVEDWNVLSYGVETEANVLADGSLLVSRRVNEKDRTLSAVYKGSDDKAARASAISFFNPRFTFKVHVTYHGRTRWCEGVQYAFEPSTFNAYRDPEITWTILCVDPYMRDENGNDKSFTDAKPMIGFPYVSHARNTATYTRPLNYPYGAYAGIKLYGTERAVMNNGDVETNYRVQVKAKGALQEPTVHKDGKFVKLLTALDAGDELVIDFEAAPPRVTINGQNAIHLCSRDSSFTGMKMAVGSNVFDFTVANTENRSLADVRILFHKAYLGV